MCCHWPVSSWRTSTRRGIVRLRIGAGGLAIALLAAAFLAPTAIADGPAEGEAAGPEAGAQPPAMSLEFTRRTTSLVGSRALVHVRCAGPVGQPCVGTLALQAASGAHKVAYSIDCNEEQILAVPLGVDGQAIGRLKSVRAVARTLQYSGASVDTAGRLRIR
jgi:hypothetical protein